MISHRMRVPADRRWRCAALALVLAIIAWTAAGRVALPASSRVPAAARSEVLARD